MTITFESKHKKKEYYSLSLSPFLLQYSHAAGVFSPSKKYILLTLELTCKMHGVQVNSFKVPFCDPTFLLHFLDLSLLLVSGCWVWVVKFNHTETKVRSWCPECTYYVLLSLIATLEFSCRHSWFIKRGRVGKAMNEGKVISLEITQNTDPRCNSYLAHMLPLSLFHVWGITNQLWSSSLSQGRASEFFPTQ